ncbi:flagellar hook-associated protein FlgL [Metabacillus sediminilitoris]|uniref:Flagellar hook-associated protein FlgL n=1 Tax=Metabacillus sediminilitoris TaxID=2567941 RepID=A0A4S4C1G5_9BACI|nr:flagellar hook-associated protein FlgL [Metabacillus sediminilitoris]QGQ48144.1 flagellar hook-associated protein FlgL [Metabacillus sediminilitoris]THF81493.1 flagellar hook-associated protein FlgL [Metabacillus sediminilitoris]
MRVTQGMLASNSLRHLSQSYTNMGKYQDQLATGKKITRPSDDPVVAIKGMFYRTNLTEVEQYKRNLNEAYQWMESSEAGIEHANQVVQRVRELLVQGNNGSNSPTDLQAIAVEVGQLKEDLANVANTQVAGRYIFNGTKTDTPPVNVEDDTVTVDMNTDAFNVEVSNGVNLKVNINGTNVFGQDLFNTLQSIEDALNSGNMENGDDMLGDLDKHFDMLSAERSEIGARYNRLEMVDARIQDQEIIASRILSENEDADLEKVITDLTIQESIHRASLAVSSKVIQPTLIDFLR